MSPRIRPVLLITVAVGVAPAVPAAAAPRASSSASAGRARKADGICDPDADVLLDADAFTSRGMLSF
jgi:hypothetical protein